MTKNIEAKKQHDHQKKYFNDHFNKFKDYKLPNWRISYIKRIFDALGIKKNLDYSNKFYLDVGVGGSGYTVIEAAKKGLFSIGTDSSLVAMKKANHFARLQNVEHLTSFILCYAENLPFKDNVFSKLSSIAVLEHIVDDKKAVEELARVMKAGAKLFITAPNVFKKISPLLRLPYKFHDKKIGHLRHYSEEDMRKISSQYGLLLKDAYCTGKLPKLLQLIFNEKFMGKLGEKLWWLIEERDFAVRYQKVGVALNILFSKKQK